VRHHFHTTHRNIIPTLIFISDLLTGEWLKGGLFDTDDWLRGTLIDFFNVRHACTLSGACLSDMKLSALLYLWTVELVSRLGYLWVSLVGALKKMTLILRISRAVV
jgi:hypothetical protein